MKHDTETVDGQEYPAPGEWSVNWVEGDVIAWRYGDAGDRLHDGPAAHLFVIHGDDITSPDYRLGVDGDTVGIIDDATDRDALFDRVGDLLAENTPD